jgi:membrane protein YdbS with pleckstrin-like domain
MVNFLQLILGIIVIVIAFLQKTWENAWMKWALVVVGALVIIVSLIGRSKAVRTQ